MNEGLISCFQICLYNDSDYSSVQKCIALSDTFNFLFTLILCS